MSAEPPMPPDGPPTEATQPLRPVQPIPPRVAARPREPLAPERVVERVPPAYPPDEPGREGPWPAIVAGILALLVGGVLGYAIGNHESGGSGRRSEASTATVTRTVVQPKVVEHSRTVTAPNTASEERRVEAETSLRKAERENEELKRQLEANEGG